MAKVTNPNIPTDLQAQYNDLISLQIAGLSEPNTAQLTPGVRTAQPPAKPKTEFTTMAQDAANWLTSHWKENRSKAEQSQFFADRHSEIMLKQFTAPYWATLTLAADRTGTCTISVQAFTGNVYPDYQDPLRQPTNSLVQECNRVYATPTYPSLGTDKSPSWHGQVNNGFFEDTWFTKRLLEFTIPTTSRNDTRRPIAIYLNCTVEATSTIRGNKVWFTPSTKATVRTTGFSQVGQRHQEVLSNKAWWLDPELPGNSPGGWSHEEHITTWRYGNWKQKWKQQNTGDIIIVEVGTTPSRGRYYSNNDSITVTHNETVAVYWPLKPSE